MGTQIGFEMDTAEVTGFLSGRGHGVLCLGKDDRGYGIPVSYGFDEDDERFVMELINTEDSKKWEFVQSAAEATLTVYEFSGPDDWRSVIATGPLDTFTEAELGEEASVAFLRQSADVAKEIRWTAIDRGFDRQWIELRPDHVTGRQERPEDLNGDLP
ncbi:MAG: pyridoxamine 5'-phosphate oxidase family protein [Haloarculaceae archaeon]